MVYVIENPVMMTEDEIEETYDGKWVYVVNCEFTPGDRLVRGKPVVVADMQFEDVDSGIYDRYDAEEYGDNLSMSLLDSSFFIPSVSMVLCDD